MKYIFQLVRLRGIPSTSAVTVELTLQVQTLLVFLSSLRQRIRLKFPKLVGEQMTKVPNELKFFSLLCNAISPIVLKSSSHFIIASHAAQQSSSTVSLHLKRWMHSNLKLFIGCVLLKFLSIPFARVTWHLTIVPERRRAHKWNVWTFNGLFECFNNFARILFLVEIKQERENISRILKWSKRVVCFMFFFRSCRESASSM